jgi:nitroreductase
MLQLKLKYRLLNLFVRESIRFFILNIKYNASVDTKNDIEKMQYTLLRENHVIEKGLSMRRTREGFGQQRVVDLLNNLEVYIDKYYSKDEKFINYPISTIKHYIVYTKANGVDISSIEEKFTNLLSKIDTSLLSDIPSGVYQETKLNILSQCNTNFASLLNTRHSLRYFAKKDVQCELLEKALILAQKTPSACNRQAWKTHVFMGNLNLKLLLWQGGCNGFEEEIPCSILVTANLKAFLYYEVHQAYVDGGLYAMNLINALHSLGLGTIPLSTAFSYPKLKLLSKFEIPENEIPIVIIGVGHLTDVFKVAISERKNIDITNTYHV